MASRDIRLHKRPQRYHSPVEIDVGELEDNEAAPSTAKSEAKTPRRTAVSFEPLVVYGVVDCCKFLLSILAWTSSLDCRMIDLTRSLWWGV